MKTQTRTYDDDGHVEVVVRAETTEGGHMIDDHTTLTDQQLARELLMAENAPDDPHGERTERIILATTEICDRLRIPAAQTEQGLTPEAADQVERFCVRALLGGNPSVDLADWLRRVA